MRKKPPSWSNKLLHTNESAFDLPGSIDPGILRSFSAKAEMELASIRSGILIFLQDNSSASELKTLLNNLRTFTLDAHSAGLMDVADTAAQCGQTLANIINGTSLAEEDDARRALDMIVKIEAAILQVPLQADDPYFSISGFLDESFERLMHGAEDGFVEDESETEAGFEIDEETLEIFRSEASELLESISTNLKSLSMLPGDRDALWNIRRSAHTFKGAAGVIGLKDASELAHRVEDLLDRLSDENYVATSSIIEILKASMEHLSSMTLGSAPPEHSKTLAQLFADFDRVIADSNSSKSESNFVDTSSGSDIGTSAGDAATVKPPPAPIARVALDKLDELLNLTRGLALNRTSLIAAFSNGIDKDALEKVGPLFEEQRKLTHQIQEKLLQIRMVRFGTLTTRLNRAVHVTCQEEDKKAELIVENEDVEIDTQILDSLVEPLLHLLRNAVAHGIEAPERRRLIAKPEKGSIQIKVESGANEIVISVRDDGQGISAAKLREKAVLSGVKDADKLSDEAAIELIFERGLTTADRLSMNAGRGVGMSIVRESIGSTGGAISISTEPQRGTTFKISIPVVTHSCSIDSDEEDLFNSSKDLLSSAAKNDLNILVVDDSSSMRQLLKRIVEDAGMKCITATDGQDAVEILSDLKNRPDLILTDLEMPNINGYELLEILKNEDEMREIPVIMITSRTDDIHRRKALQLGAVEFISKPFSTESVIESIKQQVFSTENNCML